MPPRINHNTIVMKISVNNTKIGFLLVFCSLLGLQASFGQEPATTELNSNSTYHNQLFFNRFLINPTFSLVRENKSYINILHRNQYATFEDNDQNYFLGFSNKLNDRTALGVSVYSQWSGVVQEFGFNANYATAVRLGEKNKLTFGTNLTYFTEGLDKNRVVVADADKRLEDAQKESKLAIQPGVTLSLGQFDIGLYAQDLLKYNQTTNEFATNLSAKTVKASLQYTYEFMQNRGLFANARLMPLVQVGQNVDGSVNYTGSMMLDLPDYGWLQANFDQEYGLSTGLGFNLSKKMSLGYLLERDLVNKETDLGWNHEVTLAYTLDREHNAKGLFAEGSEDEKVDRIVRNYEEQILALKEEVERNKAAINSRDAAAQVADNGAGNTKDTGNARNAADVVADREVMESMANMNDAEANALAYENRLILDELILRQDSIDVARSAAFDQRLASAVAGLQDELKRNGQSNGQVAPTANTAVASNDIKSEIIKRMDVGAVTKKSSKKVRRSAVDGSIITDENPQVAETKINAEPLEKMTPALETTKVAFENTAAVAENTKAIADKIETVAKNNIGISENTEAVAANTAQKDENADKAYTRTLKFEPVDKVLGEIIAKPAVTGNANVDDMKDGVKLPFKTMKRSELVGAKSGYYVIANVFKTKKYLDSFLNDLRQKGLDAGYFHNKENGLHYVYLADYSYKDDAKSAYVSNLNGQYNEEKWIMQVDNASAIVDNYYEDQ